jgi:hypothetical protein
MFAFTALLMLPAAQARAEPEMLFPPATEGCYVSAEITPVAANAPPYRKPAVPAGRSCWSQETTTASSACHRRRARPADERAGPCLRNRGVADAAGRAGAR